MIAFWEKNRVLLLLGFFLALPLTLSADEKERAEGGAAGQPPLILTFTGDMMAHATNYRMEDYSRIYRGLESYLEGDDLTFSNVEFPINPDLPMSNYPVFNIHPSYLQAAVEGGVDVLALANNHTYDQGRSGFTATLKAVKELQAGLDKPLYYSGGVLDGDPFEPLFFTHRGWRLGYLSVAQYSNRPVVSGTMPLVDYRRKEASEEFLSRIAEASPQADLFILAYHGGEEYNFTPPSEKREFFRALIRAGVDIVWGHHPHVLQPVERVRRSDGTSGLILYSLGNFISGQGRISDPAVPEEEWSSTGDSILLQTRWRLGEEGPVLEEGQAVAIAQYLDHANNIVLMDYRDLRRYPVPPRWRRFYQERALILQNWIRQNTPFGG